MLPGKQTKPLEGPSASRTTHPLQYKAEGFLANVMVPKRYQSGPRAAWESGVPQCLLGGDMT